jgi:hypothetical protein
MSLVPEIQGLVNDTRFFDYSPTQAGQSMYMDYLDPSKKVQEQQKKPEDSYLVTFSGKEISVVVGIVDMVNLHRLFWNSQVNRD